MDAFATDSRQPFDDGRIPPEIDAGFDMAAPREEDSGSLAVELRAPTISRAYQCLCGRPVYLRNSQCLACGTHLGYVTERLGVMPLESAHADGSDPYLYVVHGDRGGRQWRRCANFNTASRCNWMVPQPRTGDDTECTGHGLLDGFCLSCSATRTIPDQSVEGNGALWNKLELAKRRLMSQLLVLGLPIVTRHADPYGGLAFDFLNDVPGGPAVVTGHEGGVITLNAAEAEDVVREQIRAEMREPYRTLVGHFRHEIGHYYWDQLVYPTDWLFDFRELFGDERVSYMDALRVHYEQGPRPDWASRCVTSYASAHPWEDWAETWAHYLHMADAADTAMSFGVDARNVELAADLFDFADLWQPDHPGASKFLDFLNGWVRLTNVLNELSRSMGQSDYYPFTLPRAAVGKLQFIHQIVTEQRLHAQAIGEMPVPEAVGDDGTTDVPDDVEERDDGVSDDGFAPSPSRNRMPVQIAA
jgi:hypothetical protein